MAKNVVNLSGGGSEMGQRQEEKKSAICLLKTKLSLE